MAKKTNFKVNGNQYYKIQRTVGKRLNENGVLLPVRKVFYGKSRKEAEEKYNTYMSRINSGYDGGVHYFGELADAWVYDFLLNDGSLKNRTKEVYINSWRKYVEKSYLYELEIHSITAATLQNFYNTLNAPTSAIKKIHNTMQRFYRYLEIEGYARNVTYSLVVPKRQDPITGQEVLTWTDDEIRTIMNSFSLAQPDFRLRFLIVLAYHTGCRLGELLAITYSDIKGNSLLVNKQTTRRAIIRRGEKNRYKIETAPLKSNSSYRLIPLNETVMKELEIHKDWQRNDMIRNGYRTNFLFTTSSGNLYDRHNIPHACERYYKRIGVPAKKFHTYRHTFGTNLCRNGVPIQIAASLMGHSDISVTAKYYVNVSVPEKLEAVETLSFSG